MRNRFNNILPKNNFYAFNLAEWIPPIVGQKKGGGRNDKKLMWSFMSDKNMDDTIFTDEFLEVKNDEELEMMKSKYQKYDSYYVASGCIKERHDYFDKLWQIYKSFADEHFLTEIKKHFHQRTWEMYLGTMLIQNNFDVSSFNKGPDFVLNEGKDEEIFIEAVTCEKGDTIDAVPEMFVAENPEDIKPVDVPHDEMLIRLVNSLDSKYKKYKDFIKKEKKPYIIAVNRGGLDHVDDIPLILKCLFGIGFRQYKKVNGKLVYAGWGRRCFIEKKNGSKVPMTFFDDKKHDIVSAVIYSDKSILSYMDGVDSDCMVVHNLNAKFPVDLNIFSFLEQRKAEFDENGMDIKKIK